MKIKELFFKHLKLFRIIAAVIAFAMIAGVLLFANALVGNPVSYFMVKSKAEKYVAANYADKGYYLESVNYSFKNGEYYAHVAKPGSEDCYFSLNYWFDGRMTRDYYESSVLGGSNTRRRLDMRYRELVKSVAESPSFPYGSDIAYGTLIFGDRELEQFNDNFGLREDDLVPDGIYDIAKLGEQAGMLTIYVSGLTSEERVANILLDIKSLMEQGGVPFHAIGLNSRYFILSEDIYEDGLVERVKNSRFIYEDEKK